MDLLRFMTAGSVDDGKSTLIGRLLYDSRNIMQDQLLALQQQTKTKIHGEINLALLTDGLRAEREQGITIDVAYKYFSTPKRKFIIADAPGHIQYTRNMITGASNVSLIIILIDARHGVVEQTRRHSIIASLLGIPRIIVAINKIDLVNYDGQRYNQIVQDYQAIAKKLTLKDVTYIPISALNGDNIVDKSFKTSWYDGKPLLTILEEVELTDDYNLEVQRFQVQHVLRPQTAALHDYRGYAGKIISGIYRPGDEVVVLPAGITTRIKAIEIAGEPVEEAFAPQSVILQTEDDVDISRGDSIHGLKQPGHSGQDLSALVCWLDHQPLQSGNKYTLQHNSRRVRAIVKDLDFKLNVNTLDHEPVTDKVTLNEVVKATIKTSAPITYDAYLELRQNGAAILIDETSNNTVAAVILQ